MHASQKTVGKTKHTGYQAGVRRTFAIPPDQVWDFLTSEAGLQLWVGEISNLNLEKGASYQTDDGTSGKIATVTPGGHIRLTWQPAGWSQSSTLQVRVIPNREKTTISFHQENLTGPEHRASMLEHWKAVLIRMGELLDNRATG